MGKVTLSQVVTVFRVFPLSIIVQLSLLILILIILVPVGQAEEG